LLALLSSPAWLARNNPGELRQGQKSGSDGILAVQQVVEAHFPPLAIISRWAFTCATISGSKSSG